MAGKNTAVFGIYPNRLAALEAVDNLRSTGFRGTDVSLLFPDNQGTKDLGHEKNTKAPEGAVAGGVLGLIAGAVLGWLLGSGVIAIPALSPYIASGPVVSAMAGACALMVLGGIIGGLAGLGIPEYEARRFVGRIRGGGVLLSAHCDNSDWIKRARDVMKQTGGQDIGVASEKTGDFANADRPMPRVRGTAAPVTPVIADDPGPAPTIRHRILDREGRTVQPDLSRTEK